MSKNGRKSKLTEERQEEIVEMIEAGNYSNVAARAAGIGETTFWRWLKEGEEAAPKCEKFESDLEDWEEANAAYMAADGGLLPFEGEIPTENEWKYWNFREAVKDAEAKAEISLGGVITKAAANGDWKAAEVILSRKYSKRWGRQDTIKHEGTIEHAHTLGASEEEIEAARKRLAEARQQLEPGDGEGGELSEGTSNDGILEIEGEVLEDGE